MLNLACKNDKPGLELPSGPAGCEEVAKLFVSTTKVPGVTGVEYDKDRRVVKYADSDKNAVLVTYSADSVVFKTVQGIITIWKIYNLDNGLVKQMKSYIDEGKGEKPEAFTVTFIYSDGKLKREVYAKDGKEYGYSVFSYDSSNQNLLKSEEYLTDGTLQYKRTFEYTGMSNRSGLLDDDNNVGMSASLFPKKSEKLIGKTFVDDHVNNQGQVLRYINTYAYELDSEGYVTKVTRVSNGVADSWTNAWK